MRTARAGVAVALLAAGAAVGTAAPASASISTSIQSTSWSYTDSAQPKKSFVNPAGTAPVGAKVTADGKKHVSKSYFTFDLTGLRGAKVLNAELSAKEVTVADCAAPRTTELWVTAPSAKPPTWETQPAELSKLPGPGSLDGCPSNYLDWDAGPTLQQAIDAGRTSLTLVLRLPDGQQHNPRFARTHQPSLYISLEKNQAPDGPTSLTTRNRACAESPVVGLGDTRLFAIVTDPDDYQVGAEFAWWPVAHPDQRQTQALTRWTPGYPLWIDLAQDRLADGVTYDWQVRGTDELTSGPWSGTCRFTTDFTAPTTVPLVTSTDFPSELKPAGGVGVPGVFTFDARGDQDVVRFAVGESVPPQYVTADKPGGTATYTFTPRTDGPQRLLVRGVDAGGNSTPSTSYRFWVGNNGPSMTCAPAQAFLGETRQCTFGPHGTDGATEYVYRVDGEPEVTVPAGPDGTAAFTITPTDAAQRYDVEVRARMANGNLSADRTTQIAVDRGLPVIDAPANLMVGQPAVFTLHATLPGSATFTYDWDYGTPVTIPVGPDGTAQVTITPAAQGQHWLHARTTTAAGLGSAQNEVNVTAATNGPSVTSVEYPESAGGGYVTTPGTFTFTSPLPGAVSFTYRLQGADPATVPAGPDGTASAVLTPLTAGRQYLETTTTFADGTVSAGSYYWFIAESAAPPLTCDGSGSLRPGQVVHCTLAPVQPGLVSYGYAVNAGTETTVQPGPGGTAAFEFTVPADQTQYVLRLEAWSVNAAGLRTDTSYTSYWVDETAARVTKAV
ncbi:DNRLRE domain-containing protein [Amycolatopsis solani]|uniref:DNRLRE domain-containing protein n=1 Tax=Amycolatopsis solani TaxID=3028615 RepID=UPI0025AF07FB|nr:DNRLRE domain-containing protein [Amycolatopsis sp. MEP2-6]